MRTLVALLLLVVVRVACADNVLNYVFTISPNPVPPGSEITVTVAAPDNHCAPLYNVLPWSVKGSTVHISVNDSDGCESLPAQTRTYSIGTLPEGVYTFSFGTCSGIDDNGNTICQTLEEFVVTVQGSPAPLPSGAAHTIPILSLTALIGLSVLVMAIAASWRRG